MTTSTYIANITADLPRRNQEHDARHPLVRAEARLARKVVQVRDQPVEDVSEPVILSLVVDAYRVRRDVINRQVEQHRRLLLRDSGHFIFPFAAFFP